MLSEQHKQAIITLKTIFKDVTTSIKAGEHWQEKVPFITCNEYKSGTETYKSYWLTVNGKNYPTWNRGIFLTLLHILYNKIKNKKRGHTQDDTAFIQKHEAFYKAICERTQMQQFILEANKESTDASCSTK
jgi:hypothetical protein